MAGLSQALEAFADLGGHDAATWSLFVRELRATGELPATKRGMGATKADAAQVATLLLGGMSTDSPRKAPERVRTYRNLVLVGIPEPERFGPPELIGALQLSKFGDTLEALIVQSIRIAKSFLQRSRERLDRNESVDFRELRLGYSFDLTVHRNAPWASLTIAERGDSGHADRPLRSSRAMWSADGAFPPVLHWQSSTTVSLEALMMLAVFALELD